MEMFGDRIVLQFPNGGRLIQNLSELPNLKNAKALYLDTETTSFDSNEPAFKPYHGHRICGIAATADDVPGAWYVPIRCTHEKWNLPLDPVLDWAEEQINSCYEWVNHNVKFDAHFAKQDGIIFNCRLVDTNTLSKIINSDRFGYELNTLSREWLEEDTSKSEDRLKAYLAGCKSKNYGDVPGDIIGEYACQDVLTNRKLHRYILRRRHEQTETVWETEILLTPVLFDMEVIGLHVDRLELQQKQLVTLYRLSQLEEELHKLTGYAIRPHTNADCYEVLCNKYGLPILGRTEKLEPSFDKAALISYLAHPLVQESELLTTIVNKVQAYRKLHTLNSLFLTTYLEHEVNGVMHPDYNQIVRTGRMSCRRPNSQQLSEEAKELVHPPEGQEIISWDFSQIEFRIIVHYIKDKNAIVAYNENPDTDFHNWVAEMCGIPRDPAKNVNFAIAFGGGKKKVVSMLALNMELVGGLLNKVEELVAAGKVREDQRLKVFEMLCYKRGENVYQEYHSTLPGLRIATRAASNNLLSRGYVFNAYGRHRHLPEQASYRAFNTIVQSTAADVIKERTVALAPRYNKFMRDLGINFFASVHDETAQYNPIGLSKDVTTLKKIKDEIENVAFKFRVPMRTSCGVSDKNWKIASKDKAAEIKLI